MASAKQIDVNVISRNGTAGGNRLVALTIDDIVSVYKDGSDVTTIKYQPDNDNHTSMAPVRYKVPETLAGILVKANAQDSNNGLISLTITKVNNYTLPTAKVEILNRTKVKNMTPISGGGTKIKYGHWFLTIYEVSENLVTETGSS